MVAVRPVTSWGGLALASVPGAWWASGGAQRVLLHQADVALPYAFGLASGLTTHVEGEDLGLLSHLPELLPVLREI